MTQSIHHPYHFLIYDYFSFTLHHLINDIVEAYHSYVNKM